MEKEVIAIVPIPSELREQNKIYTFYTDGTFEGDYWKGQPSEWKLIDNVFYVKHCYDADFKPIEEDSALSRYISESLRTEIIWKKIIEEG